MHTTHSNTQYKNESKQSEMGPVRQNPTYLAEECSDEWRFAAAEWPRYADEFTLRAQK